MKAEYITHMGSDLTVVNAARVSFDKQSDWEHTTYESEPDKYGLTYTLSNEPKLKNTDKSLIRFLSEHKHWTPFSHCMITMRETVPIFVARQRFKHTVGFTYNEISRRYVVTEPSFYVPVDNRWRLRAPNKKQGSLDTTVPINPVLIRQYYEAVLDLYNKLLEQGVAPEQARMVLPQSMYTSYYVTGSLAAWARAYSLRSGSDAQSEIRDLASQWNSIIEPLFPESWKALNVY